MTSSTDLLSDEERKVAEVVTALGGDRFVVYNGDHVLDTITGETKQWVRSDIKAWCKYLNDHHRNAPTHGKLFTPGD